MGAPPSIHQPEVRRSIEHPEAQLDVPRLIRTLPPGASADYCVGTATRVREQQQPGIRCADGERDEEAQFGVNIPWRGWVLDADMFRTDAANFFDHNNIGESNLFFPLTIQGAKIRGWEVTLRSPRIAHRGQVHLSYSNRWRGRAVRSTGGLLIFHLWTGVRSITINGIRLMLEAT